MRLCFLAGMLLRSLVQTVRLIPIKGARAWKRPTRFATQGFPAHGSGVIPAVGFGTLIHDPLVAKQATKTALEVGYRHLDCAERYRTEEAVGQAMQESFNAGTIRRKDVFVTTKLWNTNHRPERVKPAFDASRRRLQID